MSFTEFESCDHFVAIVKWITLLKAVDADLLDDAEFAEKMWKKVYVEEARKPGSFRLGGVMGYK